MSEHTTHTNPVTELRRLERSRSDRMLAGVSGGLARYFDIHPAVFRVGFVVLTLLGGAGILIYAAAALVMPDEGKQDSVATAALRNRRDHPWPLIGLGLVAVGGAALLSRITFWPDGGFWVLLLVAGALILWVTRHSPADAPATDGEVPARRRPSVLRRTLVTVGVVVATLLATALVAAAAAIAVFDVDLDHGIGDRTYVVTTTEELRDEYRLSVGTLDLDLRSLELPAGETHVDARVDIGDLLVMVPADVALQVRATAEVGDISLPDGTGGDGRNVESAVTESGDRVLVLDASVGAGSIRIERALR
jgi:phage shock protein PspC (stress-responsive transcriptional regulator)